MESKTPARWPSRHGIYKLSDVIKECDYGLVYLNTMTVATHLSWCMYSVGDVGFETGLMSTVFIPFP